MPELATRIRMLLARSGAGTQGELSAWLLATHRCEVSQGTISNWINGRVRAIAPEKHYALGLVFRALMEDPAPGDVSALELPVEELGARLGFSAERVRELASGAPAAEGARDEALVPLPFPTLVTRRDEMAAFSTELAGIYIGHSYSLRDNGLVTVSVLSVGALRTESGLLECTLHDRGRYAYRGAVTLLKNDLIYCLLEESSHHNEMVQLYLTSSGTNEYRFLYGILSGISGERPGVIASTKILYERLGALGDEAVGADVERLRAHILTRSIQPGAIDPGVEAIIRNEVGRGDDGTDFVLRAGFGPFKRFCDALEDRPTRHPWQAAARGVA